MYHASDGALRREPRRLRLIAAMIIAVVVAALLPLLGAVPAYAAEVSETEPNNTMATADAIALGDTVDASAAGVSSPDYDWFAFDVPSAGRGTLSLTFPQGLGTGTAYYVDVYDLNGVQLYSFDLSGGQWDGSWLRSQATYLPAGRVYVEVRGYNGNTTWGQPYKLSLGLTLTASAPTISGTPASGSTLTAKPGSWTAGAALAYQWYAKDATGTKVIAGATNPTLLLGAGQVGKNISVKVTGSKPGYATASKTSTATPRVALAATPTISGTRAVGFTLTASHGTWTSGTAFSYAWYANGAYISGSSGATHSTFKLTSAQQGKQITVKVTGTLSGYATVAKTSSATAKVALTSVPTITGTKTVGSTLTAHHNTWTTGTTFTYQWYANGAAITGAKYSTFKLTSAQRGKTITVKVTGSLSGYATVTRTSASTSTIG